MAQLACGGIADRPWGRTLGALGLRGFSGQLTVTTDGKRYQIAFAEGAVIGATSPISSDAAVRIAMTGGLVSSTLLTLFVLPTVYAALSRRDKVIAPDPSLPPMAED